VLYRPYLRRYPTLPVSAFAMAARPRAAAGAGRARRSVRRAVPLRRGAWAAIVFIGPLLRGGYVLWLWALKTIAATRRHRVPRALADHRRPLGRAAAASR
jgi:drug/metabolite transporter (DMT)-like permease